MRKMIYLVAGIILVATPTAGCSDASRAKLAALGTAARVTCFSGGKIVLDDFSTGKVGQEEGNNIYFNSRTTGRLVELSGDCVVDHMTTVPAGWRPVLP